MLLHLSTPSTTPPNAAAPCFPEPDVLLELEMFKGPPAWVDPMLEKLATSLVVCQPTRTLVLGCPPSPWWPPRKVRHHWWTPFLWQRLSSGTMDSPLLLPVQGWPHVAVMDAEACSESSAVIPGEDADTPPRHLSLELANVRANTTIMATMADVNRTPSPQTNLRRQMT